MINVYVLEDIMDPDKPIFRGVFNARSAAQIAIWGQFPVDQFDIMRTFDNGDVEMYAVHNESSERVGRFRITRYELEPKP